MCGIVGAVAQGNVIPILLEGLKRLEYRGYDSCGVALYINGKLQRSRSILRVVDLQQQINNANLASFTGIAHTRWATHGIPATHNAHPHFSRERIAIVHNGIIENHEKLRATLQTAGYIFESQTDTEVIAHLIDYMYTENLFNTVQKAVQYLIGTYAIAVFSVNEPHRVVAARQGSPLIIGIGQGQNFVASDAIALAGATNKIIYLEEGDVVDLQLKHCWIVDINGKTVKRKIKIINTQTNTHKLGSFRNYMQKEIFEQPNVIANMLKDIKHITPIFFGKKADSIFKSTQSLLILACGTSYYAGLIAKYWIESIAKIPVNVEIASEYRYRESAIYPNTLVVTISQSGETADTLAALKHARTQGIKNTLTICNVSTSAIVHESILAYITPAGIEISVASTKAFTTQLIALFLLALTFAQIKNKLNTTQEITHLKALNHLPNAIYKILALETKIIAWASTFAKTENTLFLGRGLHYPIALEGALKLKEIAYIHAEAYPAGELKHGPLALVTEKMPVVTIAPNNLLIEKLKSNIQEVYTRGGQLYIFADIDSHITNNTNIHVIHLPKYYGPLSPILHIIPLQLLAYHTGLARGIEIDKPRNLAKSVTVE